MIHTLFASSDLTEFLFSIKCEMLVSLLLGPITALIFLRFLWRQNATFAISRHYTRFDVFEEAEANKAGGKYDNISIDNQIEFYKKEGLTPYTSAKLPITSGTSMTRPAHTHTHTYMHYLPHLVS